MRNIDSESETLAARAKAANYTPPAYKYLSMDRDVMPLLMAPEKTAFLVVDVQNFFTEPESPAAPRMRWK